MRIGCKRQPRATKKKGKAGKQELSSAPDYVATSTRKLKECLVCKYSHHRLSTWASFIIIMKIHFQLLTGEAAFGLLIFSMHYTLWSAIRLLPVAGPSLSLCVLCVVSCLQKTFFGHIYAIVTLLLFLIAANYCVAWL